MIHWDWRGYLLSVTAWSAIRASTITRGSYAEDRNWQSWSLYNQLGSFRLWKWYISNYYTCLPLPWLVIWCNNWLHLSSTFATWSSWILALYLVLLLVKLCLRTWSTGTSKTGDTETGVVICWVLLPAQAVGSWYQRNQVTQGLKFPWPLRSLRNLMQKTWIVRDGLHCNWAHSSFENGTLHWVSLPSYLTQFYLSSNALTLFVMQLLTTSLCDLSDLQ